MNHFVGNMQTKDMTCDYVSYLINIFLKTLHINTDGKSKNKITEEILSKLE
ncbi:MAG: hypothetical protein K9L74_05465 [Candidatus Izimaplasma sp.]|nr:hypothetical protein [Candidatus Izimaplasma bacterium]